MNRIDIPLFGARLNALAEVFGKPAVSVKAMEVWFDALKEFSAERVLDVLNSWAKRNGRFPAPAQVWERVNEILIEEREKQNRIERAMNAGPAILPRASGSPFAAQCMVKIREMLSHKHQPDPRAWAKKLLARRDAGEQLLPIQIDMAESALRIRAVVDREPGQDDEERAA